MNKAKFRAKFPPILSHTGYHQQEELAKFGYKSERKLERIKDLTDILGSLLEPIV